MDEILAHWQWVATPLVLIISLFAFVHVVLYKRDSRAAVGWVGIIWLIPLFGSLLYFVLGINRIERRANRLRRRRRKVKGTKAPAQDPVAAFTRSFVPD